MLEFGVFHFHNKYYTSEFLLPLWGDARRAKGSGQRSIKLFAEQTIYLKYALPDLLLQSLSYVFWQFP